jgi:hypothetical protein
MLGEENSFSVQNYQLIILLCFYMICLIAFYI